MKNIHSALLALLPAAVMFAFSVSAEVYTLWPFGGGGGGGGSSGSLYTALNPKELWSEPVRINGQDMKTGISLLDQDLRSAFSTLSRLYPDAKFASNRNSLIMELREKSTRRRIYLVELGGIYPVLQFTMTLPEKIPPPQNLPNELPLPPGSDLVMRMDFPGRNSVYGLFESPFPVEHSLAMMKNNLRANGWKIVTGESAFGKNADFGALLMKPSPTRLISISFSANADGRVFGAVYMHSIKGE